MRIKSLRFMDDAVVKTDISVDTMDLKGKTTEFAINNQVYFNK